jgi:hypothetical protein
VPGDLLDDRTATLSNRLINTPSRELILFMARRITAIIVSGLLLFGATSILTAELEAPEPDSQSKGPARTDLTNPNIQNRVHRVGNVWMNITNWGFFGNYSVWGGLGMDDPEYPGVWAPQCEYPAGSKVQYLFQGALWLGAMVQQEGYEFPRVSTGTDGWVRPRINEFYPPEGDPGEIVERSNRPNSYNRLGDYVTDPRAVSEQDFNIVYSDTLTDDFYVESDPIDGPHFPLGIKITQKSYSWSYNYAQNFIIIDWEIENIAGNYLKNLYVGLYIDGDVGWEGEPGNWYSDDVCGFQQWFYYERPDGVIDSSVINTAWIADNDGRPVSESSGNDFKSPGITGVRVVRAPNPKLRTSFNWWISNGDPDLDFGPSWDDDGSPGGWTDVFGTPMGDTKKYFVLSNGEFDYDQVFTNDPAYIGAHPQEIRDRWDPSIILGSHSWKVPGVTDETPENYTNDLANGYDTRYLLSWGPLGIFDHLDQSGNRIYRLNPGEKFSMTIAYVAGDAFHNRNQAQPDNANIDPSLFNFNSLRYNADWAAKVYDNPLVDTPIYDWGNDHQAGTNDRDGSEGDGKKDTGDGWYGEDVGEDGLYAFSRGDVAYKWEAGVRREYIYPGPDPGEADGHLSLQEDAMERPEDLEYTRLNGMLDHGDAFPDFQGPPPPPVPELKILTTPINFTNGGRTLNVGVEELKHWVVLTWNKDPSEAPGYVDPFSREGDFEGYRIYVSNTGLERDFAYLDEYDRIDYAYYSQTDSLASMPVTDPSAIPPDTVIGGIRLTLKAVGRNIGLSGRDDLYYDPATQNYYYVIHDAHAMVPRYYSVTSYDYGDYKTGTPPLESARRANMIYAAPSGTELQKVQVVPNPYRASNDYTRAHGGGLSWENRDDGTPEFFPQTDRRLYFYNLPRACLIRIYTVSGDLVDVVAHNLPGDDQQGWNPDFAEGWDLNSRNHQQIVSGLYLFSVEDKTGSGDIETGKFVVIR